MTPPLPDNDLSFDRKQKKNSTNEILNCSIRRLLIAYFSGKSKVKPGNKNVQRVRFTSHFQICIQQQFRLLQDAKICCGKQRVVLLFATKSLHVARFSDRRQTRLQQMT